MKLLKAQKDGKPDRGPGAGEAPVRCRSGQNNADSSDYRGIDEQMERAGNVEFIRKIQGGGRFRLKKKKKKKKSRTGTRSAKVVSEKERFSFSLRGGGVKFQNKGFLI